uniref:YTH domain-containing family protein n=1 Tax=Rhizophora mucronata TaxID=61149 RepID=A0A2P2JXC2_RHIMU
MESPSPSSQNDHADRFVPTGETPIQRDSSMVQPLSPQDERIVSANSSPDAAITGPVRDARERPPPSDAVGDISIVPPINAYASHERMAAYRGFGSDGYSQYLNTADGLHISPVIFNDNASLMLQSGYGFNPEMAYGQYSPVATPLSPIFFNGQLYSPQQIPFTPSFYPQPAPPNLPSSVPLSISPSELMTSENSGENLLFGPGSGYLVHFGPFGGGNMAGLPSSSPLASPAAYAQPTGILGPYEHHTGKRPLHGYGTMSTSFGSYQHGGSYQNSGFGTGSMSYSGANDRVLVGLDKGRRRERDQGPVYNSNDTLGFDRNRGPRASKPKGKSSTEQSSPTGSNKENSSCSGLNFDLYNKPDFVTAYENAKFFIIKSFSEDNVHKSIKYSVWASTPHGNKKLDAAYREAKKIEGHNPVFLFFSVNASGQFCGVAEMVGPVDFEKDADYWQQDRWSGQFPVQWHIVKDVPNSRFRHILLQNNDNKPVTHSRDSQEVRLEHGVEMLKIFKDHDSPTSMLDDFEFYDQQERSLNEKKGKQQASSSYELGLVADETMNQISAKFAQAFHLGDGIKETAISETHAGSRVGLVVPPSSNSIAAVQISHNSSVVVSCTEESFNQ